MTRRPLGGSPESETGLPRARKRPPASAVVFSATGATTFSENSIGHYYSIALRNKLSNFQQFLSHWCRSRLPCGPNVSRGPGQQSDGRPNSWRAWQRKGQSNIGAESRYVMLPGMKQRIEVPSGLFIGQTIVLPALFGSVITASSGTSIHWPSSLTR